MSLIRQFTGLLCVGLLLIILPVHAALKDLKKQLNDHAARDLSSWEVLIDRSSVERVLPAPDFLLDYLRLDNEYNGYIGVPKTPDDWQSFADDVRAAINDFPEPVQQQLRDHVMGIFLVTDLGSSAVTNLLNDFHRHKQGFMVLDVEALSQTANTWATWRESTPFHGSSDFSVEIQIAEASHDDRRHAISYILLHELGHLVGVASQSHAPWESAENPVSYPFFALSWMVRDDEVLSRWDSVYDYRQSIRFYASQDRQLSALLIPDIYRQLTKTSFVSLYASTSVFEDFSEAYAMYVHVVMQQRPWRLSVKHRGDEVLKMTEPILQPRCRFKRDYMARLMGE